MLTKRQNMMECIRGGNPDRYVKQYEALALVRFDPFKDWSHLESEGYMLDNWGVYQGKIPGQSGLFPMHDMEHRVVKDIENWRDYVKAPGDISDSALWEDAIKQAEAIDRNEYFVTATCIPGIFERLHHLCEIAETMVGLYEYPDEMHELIDVIFDWEMRLAEGYCKYIHPDAMFHHDDWGTQISTFMAPDMFEEFLMEPYKKLYGYYKDHGVEVIVHHSDSYGMSLVPYMIELGIDVWQGTLRSTNDVPALLDKYGNKITYMGVIESQHIDKPGWTREGVAAEVEEAIDYVGSKVNFIPCLTAGMPVSDFEGVYEAVNEEIDRMSARDFV